MIDVLISTFVISLGINIVMFIPAFLFKTDKLTDISYAVTFVVVALYGLLTSSATIPAIILLAMITLWAIRLGTYLLIRIWNTGRDKRFDGMRESFVRFSRFWILQGLSVWIVMFASSLFFANPAGSLSMLSYIGIGVWLIGLLTETFADYQLYTFINKEENKGRWITTGLWKYSRHPNYFGEILHWLGIYIFTLSVLSGVGVFVGFISPLYIALLIIFVSGVPLLEKASDKRWGDNPEYQRYKKNTSILIPLP